MEKSIPASELVNVTPNVIGTGGSPLSLNSVFLTQNNTVPLGPVISFSDQLSVARFFGDDSQEAQLATVYFLGFDGSSIKPGTLYFTSFNTTAVPAWLRSASLASMTLEELKAIPAGTMTVTVDGTPETSQSINLSTATSFSNAAEIIQAAFTNLTVTYNSLLSAFVLTTGTTGAEATITYASGDIATALYLTGETGATISQGAAPASVNAFMNALLSQTQNWVTFMTLWEPELDDKMAFAKWTNGQKNRYMYVGWDSDVQATQANNTDCFGAQIINGNYNGTAPVWPSAEKAAFVCGTAASINFQEVNGRITFAYKGQSGLVADVTDPTVANNLTANGYNYYAAYATANDRFVMLQPGQMPGDWKWIDTYVNQVYLNSQFQLALMTLLTSRKSVPLNDVGDTAILSAMQDPIDEFVNFGGVQTGVELSEQQKSQINSEAGTDISNTLYTQGYYAQAVTATAQQRGLRNKQARFWFTDGGAVHKIALTSTDVQ